MLKIKSQFDFIFAFIIGILIILAIYIIFLLTSNRPVVNYNEYYYFVQLGTYYQDYNAFFDSYVNVNGYNIPAYDIILYLSFFYNYSDYNIANPVLNSTIENTLNNYAKNGIFIGFITNTNRTGVNGIIGKCVLGLLPVMIQTIYGNITACGVSTINPQAAALNTTS